MILFGMSEVADFFLGSLIVLLVIFGPSFLEP